MGKVSDFVMDFLAVVGDNEEYEKENWDWDNLPTFEKMWEIVNNSRRQKK